MERSFEILVPRNRKSKKILFACDIRMDEDILQTHNDRAQLI